MKKNHQLTSVIFLFLAAFSFRAEAFRLEPMVANFTPDGEGSTKIFRVENEGKDKIAVKVQAYTRQIDDKGKETLVESKDFKIYPEQMSLSASDSRAVRVIYLGTKTIDQEVSYRIIASQLPVSFKEESKQTGIKFLFQFVASVYVTSDKYFPKVVIESITRDKDQLRIKVINKGQKHVVLKNVKVVLKDNDGKNVDLGADLIKSWDGENLLSGTRRTFKVKTPLNFDLTKNPPKIEIKEEI